MEDEAPTPRPYRLVLALCWVLSTACSSAPATSSTPAMLPPNQPALPTEQPQPGPPQHPALAPRPIYADKLHQDPQRPLFSFANEPGKLLDGLFSVFYRREARSYDATHDYTFMTKTGHFRQGLMQGTWHTHYVVPDGGLDYTETYKDGLVNGPLVVYNADKTVHYQTIIENGNGRWKSFYATGRPELEGDYRAGREQGTWLRHGPDGRLQEQLVYENGTLLRTIPAQ